jgi:hypothetical protein
MIPKYDRRNRCEVCPSCGVSSWSAAQSKDGLCDGCSGRAARRLIPQDLRGGNVSPLSLQRKPEKEEK